MFSVTNDYAFRRRDKLRAEKKEKEDREKKKAAKAGKVKDDVPDFAGDMTICLHSYDANAPNTRLISLSFHSFGCCWNKEEEEEESGWNKEKDDRQACHSSCNRASRSDG